MGEISILRADFYSDGTVIPLFISFPDGKSEHISSVQNVKRTENGKGCIIHCSTPTKNLTLIFSDSKWNISYVST